MALRREPGKPDGGTVAENMGDKLEEWKQILHHLQETGARLRWF